MTMSLFQRMEREAVRGGITLRTKESRAWFRRRSARLNNTTISRDRLMNAKEVTDHSDAITGNMYMFYYDAKHKDTLPYWDRFPLIIAIGPAEGGFYGINLHYLPPLLRAKFLDALLDVTTSKKYTKNKKFNLTYEMLTKSAKLRLFKPCFKHYLTKHVKSNFAKVNSTEWEIATFLPTAKWVGAGPKEVYRQSRRSLG